MLLPMPMLTMCRIDGRRRPRRDDDDVNDQQESGSFSPGDLGLPSAPGFSAIHQLTGEQPVGAGRGICEGRCWGSTPRFSSFLCARLRTTFRRAQPRIASVLSHRRGSTTIHQRYRPSIWMIDWIIHMDDRLDHPYGWTVVDTTSMYFHSK